MPLMGRPTKSLAGPRKVTVLAGAVGGSARRLMAGMPIASSRLALRVGQHYLLELVETETISSVPEVMEPEAGLAILLAPSGSKAVVEWGSTRRTK